MDKQRRISLALTALVALAISGCAPESTTTTDEISTKISTLSDLTIEALRARSYNSDISIESTLDNPCVDADTVTSLPAEKARYTSYMSAYDSDGLRVYARLNIPAGPAPAAGFPTIVFAHGWVGADAAPSYTLGCDPQSMYAENTDAYARAGYAVVIPGYRGHATVNGVAAEGIEFLHAYDNGSYLSPIFYATDVMNLIAGLDKGIASPSRDRTIKFATSDLKLAAHSQGGDVALTVLAATGEGAKNGLEFTSASIWSGSIPDRFMQVRTYYAMQKTPEAFVAGDGSWNGTAVGTNGEINPNFVFGYPRDWIETPDPSEWTWQKQTWDVDSVQDAVRVKLDEMYQTLNDHVCDMAGLGYEIQVNKDGSFDVIHDPKLVDVAPQLGGFRMPDFLKEPLILHFPDRDQTSLPQWNIDLCARINAKSGVCTTFEYAENTHGMRIGKHAWFSSDQAVAGYPAMVARDVEFFKGGNPASIPFP